MKCHVRELDLYKVLKIENALQSHLLYTQKEHEVRTYPHPWSLNSESRAGGGASHWGYCPRQTCCVPAGPQLLVHPTALAKFLSLLRTSVCPTMNTMIGKTVSNVFILKGWKGKLPQEKTKVTFICKMELWNRLSGQSSKAGVRAQKRNLKLKLDHCAKPTAEKCWLNLSVKL